MEASYLRFYRSLLKIRAAQISLGLVVLQQLMVASSTLWLTQMMARISVNSSVGPYLGLFLGSMLLPYIPGSMALVWASKWQMQAYWLFLQEFEKQNESRAGIWASQLSKDRSTSALTSEAQNVLNRTIETLTRFIAVGLNTALNIAAVAWLVSRAFGVAYVFSLVSAFFVFRYFSRKQRILTTEAQLDRLQTNEWLFSAWDNVLLGNGYNLSIWRERLKTLFGRAEKSNLNLSLFSQKASLLVAMITLIPCMSILVYKIGFEENSMATVAVTLVTLPRLFFVLANTQDFFFQGMALRENSTRLKSLLASIEIRPEITVNRIHLNKISFFKDGTKILCSDLEDVLLLLAEPGRILVTGENGAGKSSLLLWIKENTKHKSCYLPPKHNLAFENGFVDGSTGEKFYQNLLETLSPATALRTAEKNPNIYLLDEWSANLDKERIADVDDMIATLAQRSTVVEVRHHVPQSALGIIL